MSFDPPPRSCCAPGCWPSVYPVTLAVIGLESAHAGYIVGMVVSFAEHAALRRRGVPAALLAVLGGMVVWPRFARDGYDPMTALASVIALVYGVWMAAENRGRAAASIS